MSLPGRGLDLEDALAENSLPAEEETPEANSNAIGNASLNCLIKIFSASSIWQQQVLMFIFSALKAGLRKR